MFYPVYKVSKESFVHVKQTKRTMMESVTNHLWMYDSCGLDYFQSHRKSLGLTVIPIPVDSYCSGIFNPSETNSLKIQTTLLIPEGSDRLNKKYVNQMKSQKTLNETYLSLNLK